MELKSLDKTSFDELFEAFEEAFADYETRLDKDGLRAMLKRRGFDPSLSFGAFDEGRLVSFTCNGIGDFYGTPTAYDTGTGTLKAYRKKGLAAQVFEHSIPHLKEAGMKQYLLEVLQHNEGAVCVYRKQGFEVMREFYYFRTELDQMDRETKATGLPCTLQPIDLTGHESIPGFWDFRPSWQNAVGSVQRSPEDFICLGAFTANKLIGYGVFEPASGDVTQLAVNRPYRRKGVGSLLFQKMLGSATCRSVKIVNTDTGCDSVTAFLRAKKIEPTGKQFEMIKKL